MVGNNHQFLSFLITANNCFGLFWLFIICYIVRLYACYGKIMVGCGNVLSLRLFPFQTSAPTQTDTLAGLVGCFKVTDTLTLTR